MKDELLKGLTEEQIAKVNACKNSEELLVLAKEEGIELSDEQLAAVNGGGCFSSRSCPKCGGKDFTGEEHYDMFGAKYTIYKCKKCGASWRE